MQNGRTRSWRRRGRDSNPRGRSTPPTRFPVALLKPLGHLSVSTRRVPLAASQAQVANPALVPAEVVRELVAKRALDLRREQLPVVSEVALERVLIEHDSALVVPARDGVAEVVAVRAVLGAEARNHDRGHLEQALEVGWEAIDGVGDEQLELGRLRAGGPLDAGERLAALDDRLELVLADRVAAHQRDERPRDQDHER